MTVLSKPHTQIGQKGKGKGKLKPGRRGNKPGRFRPPKPPPGLPATGSPNFMPFPKLPPAPPNFLPNTPGFEHAQTDINDQLAAGATRYSTQGQLIPAAGGLQLARLGTDEGFAKNSLMEDMADRGIVGSTDQDYLMNRDIQVPYGRARQDVGLGMAGQYADLGSEYGNTLLAGNRALFDAYNQRADDAFAAGPLGGSLGSYQVPGLPQFSPIYDPSMFAQGPARNGGKRGKRGKTRPKGRRGKGRK